MAKSLLSGGLGTLPLTPLASVAVSDLPDIVRRMDERITAEAASSSEASVLWASIYVLMGLKYPKEVTNQLLKGVRQMRESVTYQAILDKGR